MDGSKAHISLAGDLFVVSSEAVEENDGFAVYTGRTARIDPTSISFAIIKDISSVIILRTRTLEDIYYELLIIFSAGSKLRHRRCWILAQQFDYLRYTKFMRISCL